MKHLTTYSIVERDQDGHYTRRALLYQDILKFAVFEKKGSFFKDRELANWLLTNNHHYFNYYQDPSRKKEKDAVKVNTILYDGGVRERLDDFISMGLLEKGTAPADTSPHDVRVCRCMSDGALLAWLIKSIDPDNREKEEAIDDAYDIMQIKLNADPQSSAAIFHSALYKKYKQQRLFGKFVIDPLRESLESNPGTRNMRQLQYASLVIKPTNDPYDNMLQLSLWEETFSEMKQDIQDLLFYNMKLGIEQGMIFRCRHPKLYEEARYGRRANIRKVVLQAYCEDCKVTNCVDMNLIEYIRKTNLKQPIKHKCPGCNNDSLTVPVL